MLLVGLTVQCMILVSGVETGVFLSMIFVKLVNNNFKKLSTIFGVDKK